MTGFTTRPEIRGTFGVVATTHYLGSMVGMKMLEAGGNAVDAACAAGFALQVAEPHLCGPAGDAPILIHSAREGRVVMVGGQGPAPQAATLQAFRELGLHMIPGTGLLPAVVPGAFDAWCTALARYGTLHLADVLGPAVAMAREGIALLPRVCDTIAGVQGLFEEEWPTSAAVWLPGGSVPRPDARFRNPQLAETYQRLIDEEQRHRHLGREPAIQAARDAWYKGFVAEAIERFVADTPVMDVTGRRHRGLLTADDLARWSVPLEVPLAVDTHGVTVHKGGVWSQGPVLLQQLRLLEHFDLAAMGHNSADYIHTIIECAKLAYADREVYYGDPDFTDVPIEALLSREYAAERARLVDPARASLDLRPGTVGGRQPSLDFLRLVEENGATLPDLDAAGVGEPATSHLGASRGDTVHVDVIDREGNMVAATPSGGWLHSSPVIPPLGFPLGTRGQMFWLSEDHPNGLRPGKRPRTTLTPTMVTREGRPLLAFGTPGGDTQDQWNLHLFLGHLLCGLNLQEAIDAPGFHSTHFPSSFYPRGREPGGMVVEGRLPEATITALRERGHHVTVAEDWGVGRECAARIDEAAGLLYAAASPRAMSGYAVGR